jgi:geranylgeranyl diphosphate synthase type I
VVAAHQLADAPVRRELYELANRETLDDTAIARWKALIVETGAVRLIEEMIGDRIASACEHLGDLPIEGPVRTALAEMAAVCTDRAE